jgi:tetratricopeptide (TPR) repeat protein
MHSLPISLLTIFLFWAAPSFGQPSQAPIPAENNNSPAPVAADNTATSKSGLFTEGLEFFKKGDFTQSRERFSQLLKENPQDPLLLFNLGLVEFNDKHPGRALAYWRKALYLSPGFSPALSGMAQLKKTKSFPEDNPLLWLYWRVPFVFLLGAVFLFFTLSGFLWIRFAAKSKLGKPAAPWSFALSVVAFLIFTGFAIHDYQLLFMETKATIMEVTVPAYSSPSSEAPSLFEFREGDEVVVRRSQDDWLQVQKSATHVGWIKKNQLLIHSGT